MISWKSFRSGALAVLTGLLATASHAQTPTAEQIVKQCLGTYDAAKTFQGDMTLTQQRGAHVNTAHITAKVLGDGKGGVAKSVVLIEGQLSPAHAAQRQQMLDDGVNVYVIDPAHKQYAIRPRSPEKLSALFHKVLNNPKQKGPFAVTVEQLRGRPVYFLSGAVTDGTIQITVDKATLHLESAHAERGQGAARVVTTITMNRQLFNAPIPASTFVWKPPAGYTKMTPGVGKRP